MIRKRRPSRQELSLLRSRSSEASTLMTAAHRAMVNGEWDAAGEYRRLANEAYGRWLAYANMLEGMATTGVEASYAR